MALELMLGTVGTGANECVRCGAAGAAGVGVGVASGAPRPPASGFDSGPPIGPTKDAPKADGKGPWNVYD